MTRRERLMATLRGEPVDIADGYATWSGTYDDRGRVTSESFLDCAGKSVTPPPQPATAVGDR